MLFPSTWKQRLTSQEATKETKRKEVGIFEARRRITRVSASVVARTREHFLSSFSSLPFVRSNGRFQDRLSNCAIRIAPRTSRQAPGKRVWAEAQRGQAPLQSLRKSGSRQLPFYFRWTDEKVRDDSTWNRLTPDQREGLEGWLFDELVADR